MKTFISRNRLISVAGIVLLIAFWKVVSFLAGSEQIFPSPENTLISVIHVFQREGFWISLINTISRGLSGFIISFFLSFMVGIPAGINRSVYLIINPFIVAVRSTPIISLILLAIIWLGNEYVPVFIAVLTMFPIMTTNIADGIRNVDPSLIEMGKVYGVGRRRILHEISIPSIIPFIFSGISTALGFGWRAIIIGEVVAQPRFGIGTQMQISHIYLQVSELIAWTFIAIVISYFFESAVRLAERKIVKWK
jgi:NitT/TauT family transport system permease protein